MTCTCRLFATPPPITVQRRMPESLDLSNRPAVPIRACATYASPDRVRAPRRAFFAKLPPLLQAALPHQTSRATRSIARAPACRAPSPRLRSKQADRAPPACVPVPPRARVILLCFRSPCKSLRFPFPSPSRKRPPRPSRVAYVAPLCNLPRTARARASLGHTPRASPYKNGGAPRVAGQLTL